MSKNLYIVNTRISNLNATITKRKLDHLLYPVYSFVKIVSNYYDANSNTESMILYILTDIFGDYGKLFNGCTIENIVLGVLLYVTDEYNITEFINLLYKTANIKKNTIQINYIANQLETICDNVLPGIRNDISKTASYINLTQEKIPIYT